MTYDSEMSRAKNKVIGKFLEMQTTTPKPTQGIFASQLKVPSSVITSQISNQVLTQYSTAIPHNYQSIEVPPIVSLGQNPIKAKYHFSLLREKYRDQYAQVQ